MNRPHPIVSTQILVDILHSRVCPCLDPSFSCRRDRGRLDAPARLLLPLRLGRSIPGRIPFRLFYVVTTPLPHFLMNTAPHHLRRQLADAFLRLLAKVEVEPSYTLRNTSENISNTQRMVDPPTDITIKTVEVKYVYRCLVLDRDIHRRPQTTA